MMPTIERTASGKEKALVEFYRQLDREGMNLTDLAAMARIGRTTITLMLNGQRSGRQSWKHVIPLLSNAALFRLKQCSAWNNHAAEAMTLAQSVALEALERQPAA